MFVVTSEELGGDLVCKKKMVKYDGSGSERRRRNNYLRWQPPVEEEE